MVVHSRFEQIRVHTGMNLIGYARYVFFGGKGIVWAANRFIFILRKHLPRIPKAFNRFAEFA